MPRPPPSEANGFWRRQIAAARTRRDVASEGLRLRGFIRATATLPESERSRWKRYADIDWPAPWRWTERGVEFDWAENKLVDTGLEVLIRRAWQIATVPTEIDSLGVDNSTAVVVNTDVWFAATNRVNLFSSGPTYSNLAPGGRLEAAATYDQSLVTFVMRRLGYTTRATAGTNTVQGADKLMSLLGGFTVDFTAFSSWQWTPTDRVDLTSTN